MDSMQATLKPKWWNSTSTVNLQLKMVESGKQIFQATLPPGPIWAGNYDASQASGNSGSDSNDVGTMTSSDSNITQVNELSSGKGSGSGISKGGIAAAVLVPLLLLSLGLGIYIKLARAREAKSRRRWSEKIDQRMSTISIDWRVMSTKGAEAAIRASMADPSRASAWLGAGGSPRPSSTFGTEVGSSNVVEPQMAQIRRPGVGLRNPAALSSSGVPHTSRISFAPETRFSSRISTAADGHGRVSSDTRRSHATSRAFQGNSTYIPPVPSRLSEYVNDGHAGSDVGSADGGDNSNISSGMVSPTQREGPHDLSDADIQAALSMSHALNNTSTAAPLTVDTTLASYADVDPIPGAPSPPPAAAVRSPILGAMPMAMAAMFDDVDTTSPDAVLRAYAERRRTGASLGSGVLSPTGTPAPRILSPPPVASPGATPMRALYSPAPTFPVPEHHQAQAGQVYGDENNADTNPFRKSVAGAGIGGAHYEHDDDAAYFGTAQ